MEEKGKEGKRGKGRIFREKEIEEKRRENKLFYKNAFIFYSIK
jgi:hypothetical protein